MKNKDETILDSGDSSNNYSVVDQILDHFLHSLKESDQISDEIFMELSILSKSNSLSKEEEVKKAIKPKSSSNENPRD